MSVEQLIMDSQNALDKLLENYNSKSRVVIHTNENWVEIQHGIEDIDTFIDELLNNFYLIFEEYFYTERYLSYKISYNASLKVEN